MTLLIPVITKRANLFTVGIVHESYHAVTCQADARRRDGKHYRLCIGNLCYFE